MWVKFVVGSRPRSERFFSEYSGFPLSSNTNISKFQFDLDYCQALYHEPLAREIAQALPVLLTLNKNNNYNYSQTSISGSLLSGHPLLNGHFSNSKNRKSENRKTVTSIKRTRSPFRIPNWLILSYFTSIKRSHSQLKKSSV